MPGWKLAGFLFEYQVVNSWYPLTLIARGGAICKQSRLPLTKLKVQLLKNTKETIYRVKEQAERAGVRKSDNSRFGTTSMKREVCDAEKGLIYISSVDVFDRPALVKVEITSTLDANPIWH